MSWSEELARQLSRRIEGEVRDDAISRALYSTDASIYEAMPLAVVIPRHAADVRAVVEFAAEHGLPVLPRGAGTSLEGQTVNEAVVIDCSPHLNEILEVNHEEKWARVQPGVVQDGLRRHVAQWGLEFGPDTATGSHATLGGMIGNNSAGSHSIVYGKTIDHVLELRCLLADGTEVILENLDEAGLQAKQRLDGIEGRLYRSVAATVERHRDEVLSRYPKIMRHVCGYSLDYFVEGAGAGDGFQMASALRQRNGSGFNLANLIVGSEGTLAMVLEAKVGLVDKPKATALGVVQFDDLVAAMEAAREIVPDRPERRRAHRPFDHTAGPQPSRPVATLRLRRRRAAGRADHRVQRR